jgi:hypothetical protein
MIAMTNILIRYNPKIIFDSKISSVNGDLKLIIDRATFEIDPQIHLRLLYILYNVMDTNNPPSTETSAMIIDFLLMNIFKFKSVLTMDSEYEFPIQTLKKGSSYHSRGYGNALSSVKEGFREDIDDDLSLHSRPVPLGMSDKEKALEAKRKSNSSLSNYSIEEDENKTYDGYQEANAFYFENDDFSLRKIDGLRMSL